MERFKVTVGLYDKENNEIEEVYICTGIDTDPYYDDDDGRDELMDEIIFMQEGGFYESYRAYEIRFLTVEYNSEGW